MNLTGHLSRHFVDWGIDLMDKLQLKWKLFGVFLGFSFLLLGILWLFQTVFLSDTYKWIRKEEVEQAIVVVQENIDSPTLETIISELELTKEIIVRPTKGFTPPIRPADRRQGLRRAETLTKTREFVLEDGKTLSLTFYAFITPIEATVSTLQIQLIIITAVMLILASILASIVAKHIAKPIEQLNQSTKKLAMGNYDTKFTGTGFLEIKELSDTLNIAAKELAKVEGFRRELIGNVSHDLRTPLALIYSYAEMMHDFPTEITPDQSQVIMDEAKRLTSLVNDMLDMSNFDSRAAILNKTSFNLTKTLVQTMNRMQKLVKNDGYQIEFEYDEDVHVYADEVKIIRAFYNLLLNAITHSGDNKKVRVRQLLKENEVRIEITDTGTGIPKSELPHIWNRYYKGASKKKSPLTGTGLGLSIVKQIMDLHNATYGVTSEFGHGSTFWFTLNKED